MIYIYVYIYIYYIYIHINVGACVSMHYYMPVHHYLCQPGCTLEIYNHIRCFYMEPENE